ncbi:PREDICTED: uncharacterized protein LOC107330151 [Acropora digitifera]|uniref:uncharacterized protein LOC107330151 n=1 Tax=Acropora digitifera TaxID=70779 RepID=UPI00077A6E2F|nr:PREDICTED: uncharacterized protein LOC107330151 [Acropora digitifera]
MTDSSLQKVGNGAAPNNGESAIVAAISSMSELLLRKETNSSKTLIESLKIQLHKQSLLFQANQSSDQENFKLMLNSSQQRLMAVISNVWVQVIKTGRELREETTKLRMTENSSQEEIQRIKRSLTDLRQELNSRELGINETMHLKLKHNDAVQSLRMLLNSSFQEMKDELVQVWSSLNSSEKDLQAMWIAINTTEQELTLKITNVSRITGPNKALGSNWSLSLSSSLADLSMGTPI